MRHTYRFSDTPEMKDLVIEVENRNGRLEFEMIGAGADHLAPFVAAYFKSLNDIGSLAVHDGLNVHTLFWPPAPSQAHARFFEAFWRTWFFGRPTPPVVTIAITDKCQCKCVHCSSEATLRGKHEISPKDMERVVDQCISLGVCNVIFTGGEPLLHENLEACVAMVPKDKSICEVFTNALMLDAARVASLRSAGLYAVKISLDSPDAAVHDQLRKTTGIFAAVERGVKTTLDAGLLVGLSSYATNESIKSGKIERLAELAAEWGVHEVTIFDVISTGRLRSRADILLTPESRKTLLSKASSLNKQYAGVTRVLTQSWTNSSSKFAKYVGCLAATSQFHITAAGHITPCDFTPLSFGNVHDSSVAESWEKLVQHPAYQKHCQQCRMQTEEFREKYIHPIPEDAPRPYPAELLT